MAEREEVRFTQKQVDESWKEAVAQEKTTSSDRETRPPMTFTAFLTSLGVQALIHLGDIQARGSEKTEVNLEAAQETIDLLLMLREKTKGNLTPEESELLNSLVADLQFKYVQRLDPSR